MDYTRMVDSGEYSPELLTDSNKRFVEGMQYALEIVNKNVGKSSKFIIESIEREINKAIVMLIEAQEQDY